MMFYTDSKTFQNEFLTSESDNDIKLSMSLFHNVLENMMEALRILQ